MDNKFPSNEEFKEEVLKLLRNISMWASIMGGLLVGIVLGKLFTS